MEVLIHHGYKVFPINPFTREDYLRSTLYADLDSVSERIDMVDVFRAKDAPIGVTREAINVKAKVLWTQLGLVNYEA